MLRARPTRSLLSALAAVALAAGCGHALISEPGPTPEEVDRIVAEAARPREVDRAVVEAPLPQPEPEVDYTPRDLPPSEREPGFLGVVPTRVPGISDAVEVAAGDNHTCARRRNGSVVCWGGTFAYQLGSDVRGECTPRPRRVPGLRGVVELHAGWNHTCARDRRGRVYCWGDERFQQAGRDDHSHGGPTLVRQARGATAITGNASVTCAVVASGELRCWGLPALSEGLELDEVTRGASSVAELALGRDHHCLLDAAGVLRCAGQAGDGQLGRPLPADNDYSGTLGAVPGLPPIRSVRASGSLTCALSREGSVLCWGAGGGPSLGRSYTATNRRDPQVVAGVHDAVQLETSDHSCARRTDGSVACWGLNVCGQLGRTERMYDNGAATVAGVEHVVDIAVGHQHSCAVTEAGHVYCWGRNDCAQSGAPPRDGCACRDLLLRNSHREGAVDENGFVYGL